MPLRIEDMDFEFIDDTPIKVPQMIVKVDIKTIIMIVFTGN